jgi:hypothetical protein
LYYILNKIYSEEEAGTDDTAGFTDLMALDLEVATGAFAGTGAGTGSAFSTA